MAISAELSTQLRQLAAGLDLDPGSLHDALEGLVSYVRQAVPSYCGLQLTLFDHGWPVTLTEVINSANLPAVTSLRVSLQALGSGTVSGGHLVFGATTPGAFVDLAADLSYVLGVPYATGNDAVRPTALGAATPMQQAEPALIVLDVASLPTGSVSGVSGLAEVSIINRAVGGLIEDGHLPEEAHALIRGGAASAGIAPHLFAARLLPSGDDEHIGGLGG